MQFVWAFSATVPEITHCVTASGDMLSIMSLISGRVTKEDLNGRTDADEWCFSNILQVSQFTKWKKLRAYVEPKPEKELPTS